MAGLIILMAIQDEEERARRRIIVRRDNQNAYDAKRVKNSYNINIGIRYGYMSFYEYYDHNILMSVYKIFNTSRDLDIIISNIKNQILKCLNNKIKRNLLLYQVKNIDASVVSYNILTMSSSYPLLIITIHNPKKPIILSLSGDNNLKTMLYDKLDFLQSYNAYLNSLKKLSKKQLVDLYKQVYVQDPPFLFSKKRILKALLNNNKKEFLENY